MLDDLGLLFYGGEPFTEIGLAVAARSPLNETLVVAHCNGWTGYLGTDEDRRRGGYETVLWHRSFFDEPGMRRPLTYALGAADVMVDQSLALIDRLDKQSR